MKKTPFIFSIAVITATIPLVALAAWSAPSQTPPGGNPPGPVWLQAGAPLQQAGNFSVSGQGTMGGAQVNGNAVITGQATMQSATVNGTGGDLFMNVSPGQDIQMYSGNAISVNKSNSTSLLNMGNWDPVNPTGFTLGVYGDIDVRGFSGDYVKGQVTVNKICLANDPPCGPPTCRTTWPAGGGGGVTSINSRHGHQS